MPMRVQKIHLFPTRNRIKHFYWGLTKMFRPAPVILMLPRYWIGLLTHLQHDNPKAPTADWTPPPCSWPFLSFQTSSWTSVGYQLHPRHRDDVAQLRSCGERMTSWQSPFQKPGIPCPCEPTSRKQKNAVMCLISMISSIEVECIDLEGCPKCLHAGHLKVIACPPSADQLWICRFLLINIWIMNLFRVSKQQNTSTSIQKLWKMICPLRLCLC